METLSEAIERLHRAGYDADFVATGDGQLRCPACNSVHDPAEMTIHEQVRFEGESDPADEALLLALTCACGAKGLYSTMFGPEISPEDGAVVRALPRP